VGPASGYPRLAGAVATSSVRAVVLGSDALNALLREAPRRRERAGEHAAEEREVAIGFGCGPLADDRLLRDELARRSHDAMIGSIGAPRSTKLVMSTGVTLKVAGSPQEVAKLLQDAARSSPGTLAWLTGAQDGTSVGVNPAHVVVLSPVPVTPEA
jgi:hypothetical protein